MKKRLGRFTILLFVILGLICLTVIGFLICVLCWPFDRTWGILLKQLRHELYEAITYVKIMFVAICVGDPYFYWKTREGSEVLYIGEINMYTSGTIVTLEKVYKEYAIIVYSQNTAYEDNNKEGDKPLKNTANQIYSHNVKLTELKNL